MQPAVVVTVTEGPAPAPAATFTEVGSIEYVHDGAGAACVTVKVCPAMVSVPLRALPVFAATL